MRKRRARSGILSLLAEGAVVGLAATQALDWLSIFIYKREDPRLRADENLVRGGLHAYERGLDQMTRAAGKPLDNDQLRTWGWRFHKSFGIASGILYLALRRRFPRIGAGWGLAAGGAFFVLMDEVAMPLLGWTPGPRAFSWKVHARGAASHVAYGVAAETVARVLEPGSN
jgi:putative membrane protein